MALARFNTDGTLDTSFSGDGMVTNQLSAQVTTGDALAIQAYNARVLVLGTSNDHFAFSRYALGSAAIDSTRPVATASVAGLTAGGDTSYTFTVIYTDGQGVDQTTLDGNEVSVQNGPASVGAITMGTKFQGSDGGWRVTYTFTPPGGSWDYADNGVYDIYINAYSAADVNMNYVSPIKIGAFTVSIPNDATVPTVSISDAPSLLVGGTSTPYTFKVKYSDGGAMNIATFDSNDLLITTAGGFSQHATYITSTAGPDGISRIATYQLSAPATPGMLPTTPCIRSAWRRTRCATWRETAWLPAPLVNSR